jgi:L,D-transpeptidase YcbB
MIRASLLSLILVFPVLVAAPVARATPIVAADAAADLRGLLTGEGPLLLPGRVLDRAELTRLYEPRSFEPAWIGAPEREAALVKALAAASEHGLDPADFAVPDAPPAERDLRLTDAFLRYASALARGRVSSAEIEEDWAFPVPEFDAAAVLDQALTGDVAAIFAKLAPTSPAYAALQRMLVHYQALAAAGDWPIVPGDAKLVRGDRGPAIEALRQRLQAEGYLAVETAGIGFDLAVEQALKRFQERHGLAVDGRVGAGTYAALNMTAEARVGQIRANLERWRELPRVWPALRIEVNVPGAEMTVFEKDQPTLAMKTIVGAEEHPTPVMQARMVSVLFNPPWNVPASIIKKEILPHVKKDPEYLDKNHYVYTERGGIQQIPGPFNALGRVKFELPNSFDVYLHDTPSHPLFARAIRTLSHGCVRLEDPRRLALYVLNGQRGWTAKTDIDRAIDAGDTRRVMLSRTLPVYILYWTAFVAADGTEEFRDDVYDRDARLIAALADRAAAERVTAMAPASVPTTTTAAMPSTQPIAAREPPPPAEPDNGP